MRRCLILLAGLSLFWAGICWADDTLPELKTPSETAAIAPSPPGGGTPSAPEDKPALAHLAEKADVKVWQGALQVVKTEYDAKNQQVLWLVEAQKDLGQFRDLNDHYAARFLDQEDAVIDTVKIEFKPATDFKKGERFRLFLKLPTDEDTVQKTKKVVVLSRRG